MLSTAPKWPRLGIKAYEAFTNVFFLDRIERVSGGDELGAAFRTLQLRARDGELTAKDYQFLKEHMSIDGREARVRKEVREKEVDEDEDGEQ